MARKRPRLLPIYDSVVSRAVGIDSSMGYWKAWHTALTDGSGLPERLEEIRIRSGITEKVPQLRIMDVVLWMYGIQDLGIPADEEDSDA